MWNFDNLIAGAGFAGLTFAERIANERGQTSLVVEKRDHIGGNAYDKYDDHGVLIHTYGPHYFRTNAPRIKDYLSQFTEWHPVDYKILSYAEGGYWNFPINPNTFEQLLGHPSTSGSAICPQQQSYSQQPFFCGFSDPSRGSSALH